MEAFKHMTMTLMMAAVAHSGMAQTPERTGFSENFQQLSRQDWHLAEYDFTNPHFDTDWRANQVQTGDGLVLRLDRQSGKENAFVSGSVRRETITGFGRYEATMRPARGSGLVTGFFTYTGPAYGTRHDEIDIEFLGKNTSQIHVAWFVDGQLTNHFIDLGFDAADRARSYAFDWLPDRLRWWADGQMILEVTEQDAALPKIPSRLFINLWAADPSISVWSGDPFQGDHAEALVGKVSFRPLRTGELGS
ncbi:family 16 glycosylhydrolase [Sulfitobacter sp. F26204]|uniref:family 16 glycosylhydrolase n=1 Tax=Sulfitobacter sp. F26204 TaxID=2996014 RepID=UPI00225E65DB|nr:family 16 glycosylhydrolase [Sulfitobacter sp. F26204]MCX7560516.1 family 16 glycosylhydrolase [Sulfitobacter sp. F26204]